VFLDCGQFRNEGSNLACTLKLRYERLAAQCRCRIAAVKPAGIKEAMFLTTAAARRPLRRAIAAQKCAKERREISLTAYEARIEKHRAPIVTGHEIAGMKVTVQKGDFKGHAIEALKATVN
jgi:hypothetical protein